MKYRIIGSIIVVIAVIVLVSLFSGSETPQIEEGQEFQSETTEVQY